MNYNWFKVFNRTEFLAQDLKFKSYVLDLDGIGEKTFLVSNVNTLGVTYEGVFLSIELNDLNPFEFSDHAIYVNSLDDVYVGLPIET